MAKTSVGGQAVMEGVMMRAPDGIALAVRKSDGTIKKEFTPYKSAAKKGSILGLPVIRGVVSSLGENTDNSPFSQYGLGLCYAAHVVRISVYIYAAQHFEQCAKSALSEEQLRHLEAKRS